MIRFSQIFVIVLVVFFIPVTALAQIDVSDKELLESVYLYANNDTLTNEPITQLVFKFKNNAPKYRLVNTGGEKLVIDFIDAFANKSLRIDNPPPPFLNFKFTEVEDTITAIEDIAPTTVKALRIELDLMEDAVDKTIYTHSSRANYVSVHASRTYKQAPRTKWTTYAIIVGSIALGGAGIYYLVDKTSPKKKTDVIYIQ